MVGAHQGDEVGVVAFFELFAGALILIACEEVAAADEGSAECGIRDAVALAGLDDHAGVARVHGKSEHLAADLGEVRVEESAEHGEEFFGAVDSLRVGFVEPVEGDGLADAK